jgi:SpoIID/LytB domain protein
VRSQVYGGIPGEHPRTTAAVQATKGQVLLWEGKPIDALFHSTSGGSTLDAAEVFGKPVPYLVGVLDPHSALSPVHRWGPTPVAETTLRKGLALRSPVTALQLTRGRSGRLATVQVTTQAGTTKITGATLRRAGGLRSTWVTQLVTMSLARPGGAVRYGKVVTLTGRAKGVKDPVLQQRVSGVWTKVAGPSLKAKVKLVAPASFRIAAGKLAGSVLKVPVAPLVTARAEAGVVAGRVAPVAPGTTVELQQDSERGWWTQVVTTTGPAGEFTFDPAVEPGTYRVRVAPAQGFAEGLSGQIELR